MTVEELRAKAPEATAWADGMRAIFGEVKLMRVTEGEVNIDKRPQLEWADCTRRGNGKRFDEPDERKPNQRQRAA